MTVLQATTETERATAAMKAEMQTVQSVSTYVTTNGYVCFDVHGVNHSRLEQIRTQLNIDLDDQVHGTPHFHMTLDKLYFTFWYDGE